MGQYTRGLACTALDHPAASSSRRAVRLQETAKVARSEPGRTALFLDDVFDPVP
jgi:hypothetical protein